MNCELKKWLADAFAWKSLVPDVILDVLFEQGDLYFDLYNAGGQPACNIGVQFDSTIIGVDGRVAISDLEIFKSLSYLPQGKHIRIFIDKSESLARSMKEPEVTMHLTWQDEAGCCYARTIRHNFTAWFKFGYKVSD